MKKTNFTFKSRIKSFIYAFQGLFYVFKTEHNFLIHTFLLFGVVLAGVILELSSLEWLVITIISSIVLISEIINTVIEKLCDLISLEYNENIKKIKDMSAAAVLLAALAALIIGAIIFIPKLL